MDASLVLTDQVFQAFLKCRYKAFLKLQGAVGEKSDYEQSQARLAAEYAATARSELLRGRHGTAVVESPASLPDAVRGGAALITDATVSDGGESCRLDALEKVGDPGTGAKVSCYRPVLFLRREKVTAADRLVLAFGAAILARIQGSPPPAGRIVHGRQFKSSRVELASLSGPVADAVGQVRDLREATNPPRLLLNRHCPECEFRKQCRAAAVERDDLSLLGGLSAKEVAALHKRGVFTVTQYSHTFRPGRMKRAAEGAGRKHDHSLQALAIREKTVYVARRPQLPDTKVRLYLDVEGLPDEGLYYLIGLTVVEDGFSRRLSFWAEREADEAAVWASFLAAVGTVEDFILFHYGRYESQFIDQMEARHGGDPVLIGRIKARSVNVLSLVYSRVYFPAYGNGLKEVAACLGFRWSVADASGLQAIAWRYGWEATRDNGLKQRLLTYNLEDCEALERVVEMLGRVGGQQVQPGDGTGPRVAGVEDAGGLYHHRFGPSPFALPEFARITKCAYFDYQRDKVLCRSDPAKKMARRKKVRRRSQRVNREVECGVPTACDRCGSRVFDRQSRYRKLIIDLKPFHGGLKRWVTAYNVHWYRCRKCRNTQAPEDYRVLASQKYGRGVCSWIVYASMSLRLTQEAVVEALCEQFQIYLSDSSVANVRRRAVERYRPAYESLLAVLRSGRLVHADETKVKIKVGGGNGYVWVFASPETVAYVYAPTRDGSTARETLAGFRGVLVSDFYAAYDALDCPQQKCLIHLIRDFNDDLLKNPFDEELKLAAARFTTLLQAVVETIDRYGLKRYHLHKHKKDVDRYLAAETRAAYESGLARHYQSRVLKYRDKLFTFLDHDGVPWNNNTAENAVKQFACRRKTVGMPFTEAGLRDYLLLLSIYQTLRYRNASFWRFLLSGETDVAAFTAGRR